MRRQNGLAVEREGVRARCAHLPRQWDGTSYLRNSIGLCSGSRSYCWGTSKAMAFCGKRVCGIAQFMHADRHTALQHQSPLRASTPELVPSSTFTLRPTSQLIFRRAQIQKGLFNTVLRVVFCPCLLHSIPFLRETQLLLVFLSLCLRFCGTTFMTSHSSSTN